MKADKHRMTLGNKPPFTYGQITSYTADTAQDWFDHVGRHFPKPWERFRERVERHRRYRAGPKPWRPGRYTTSRWQPYSGFGRFSGLMEGDRFAYHAARYSGVSITPEHYIWGMSGPEDYERTIQDHFRRTAWIIGPPPPVEPPPVQVQADWVQRKREHDKFHADMKRKMDTEIAAGVYDGDEIPF